MGWGAYLEGQTNVTLGDKCDNCDTIVAYPTYRIVRTFSYHPYRITIALIGLIAIF